MTDPPHAFALCSRRRDGDGGIHKEKNKRSDAGKAHDNPETRLQVACVAWCDAADILVDGSPGGAAFMKGAHKARGCRPGRADLLVLEAGADGTHGLAVELKIGGNGLQSSQVAWLARARLKGWRTEVVRTALDEFCKVVCVHIGGSACDPVDLKHLLILYGRKDAPCADHSTTAFVGRGVTGQWRMRLAYAYGTCADAHAARRAAAPPLSRRRSSRRRSSRRRSSHRGSSHRGSWRAVTRRAATRRAAALAPRTAVAACAVALPTPTTAAEQLLLHQPCTRVEESLGVSDG